MRRVYPIALVALSLGFGLPACSSGGGSGGGGGVSNQLAGSMLLLPVDSTILEAEPNNTADTAHVLANLDPGGSITVIGNTTDDGSDDIDGFLITVDTRVSVTAALSASDQSSDLDIFVVDPITLQTVDAFIAPVANETGTFTAQGTFFLLIASASGSTDYTLSLSAEASPATIAEVEANDSPTQGQYLGNITAGASVSIAGELTASDEDFYIVGLPDTGNLDLALTTGGVNFDLEVLDATLNLNSPTSAAILATANNPEQGSVSLPAMSLAVVRVFPNAAGTGTYTLNLSKPSLLTAAGAPPADLCQLPRASSSLESAVFSKRPMATRFSEPVHPMMAGQLMLAWDAPPAERAALDAGLSLRGVRVTESSPDGWRKLKFDVPSGLTEREAQRYTIAMAATTRSTTGARYAEPDFWMQPMMVQGVEPNDNFYNLQWHYPQIQLPAAWAMTVGDANIITAVLDTGTTPHPDLVARETAGGFDMISDPSIAGDGDGFDGNPFDVGDSSGVQPSSYHGSHVAGTIGADTNNGSGVAGVTWAGAMMHVRVLGIGGGLGSDIRNGILWSAGLANASGTLPNNPADIINMSLGGGGFSQSTQDACTAAHNAGVVVIAAAGNENSSTPSFPAAYDDVISVAAVDQQAARAPYSNFHPSVDIAAPGGDVSIDSNGDGFADGVLSTKPDDSSSPINFDSFAFYQGTSMAAPHVAGVAGLILATNPALTPDQVEAVLTSTATDLGTPGRDTSFGEGLVNAFAAVQQAAGGSSGAPVLAVGSANVLIDSATGSNTVPVANIGGMTLNVGAPAVSTTSGGNWLSATRITIQSPVTSDTSAIRIDASGAGLPNGVYNGQVDVTSNGGSTSIGVSLAIGGGGSVQDSTVFVLAVNPDTLETAAQVVVQTGSGTGYSFEGLPPANYIIVAGTDDNNDGFICDAGEPLCGAFPSLEGLVELTVIEGENLTGLDFPLSEANFGTASTGGADRPLFRRLDVGAQDSEDDNAQELAAAEGDSL